MKRQGEGRVINFASATGMFGYAGNLAYGSNKEAIRGLTKIAAKEWAEKFPEKYNAILMQQPMRRLGDSENDIAP